MDTTLFANITLDTKTTFSTNITLSTDIRPSMQITLFTNTTLSADTMFHTNPTLSTITTLSTNLSITPTQSLQLPSYRPPLLSHFPSSASYTFLFCFLRRFGAWVMNMDMKTVCSSAGPGADVFRHGVMGM